MIRKCWPLFWPYVAADEGLWSLNVVTWEGAEHTWSHSCVYWVCYFVYVYVYTSLELKRDQCVSTITSYFKVLFIWYQEAASMLHLWWNRGICILSHLSFAVLLTTSLLMLLSVVQSERNCLKKNKKTFFQIWKTYQRQLVIEEWVYWFYFCLLKNDFIFVYFVLIIADK